MDYGKLKAQLDAAPFLGLDVGELILQAAHAVDEDQSDFVFASTSMRHIKYGCAHILHRTAQGGVC